MSPVIEIEHLTKNFGSKAAVNNVTISVMKGEIYGFLGLNGAGKTTTIRMLLGMIKPDNGKCMINGRRVSSRSNEIWNSIGYLVETPHAYPELTVWENLEIIRRLRGIKTGKATLRVMDKLKLGKYRNMKYGHLSLGNAQRVGIAKALIHEPAILVLDEPANGLDPEGIAEIREMMLELSGNENVTVFISSHILEEISKTASRIGIIHEGILERETHVGHIDKDRKQVIIVNTLDNEQAYNVLRKYDKSVAMAGGTLEISDADSVSHPESIAELLVRENVPPTLLKPVTEDLESYFFRIIRKGNA